MCSSHYRSSSTHSETLVPLVTVSRTISLIFFGMVSALRVIALFFGVMHCCANTLLKDDCADGNIMLQLNSVNTQVLGVKVQQSGGGDQAPCSGPVRCGQHNFCVGFEGANVYCYGDSDRCKWGSNDCAQDSDCSKYTTSSAKFTDGDSPSCPADGWRNDACNCQANNTSCLTANANGCNSITDRAVCLSSKDGRSHFPTLDGFKINGEPCVWCGSADDSCGVGNGNKCEPRDWMHGSGYMQDTFEVANCVPQATFLMANITQVNET